MKLKSLLFIFGITVLLQSCVPVRTIIRPKITGYVVDAESKTPIDNCLVVRTYSNSEGYYKLKGISYIEWIPLLSCRNRRDGFLFQDKLAFSLDEYKSDTVSVQQITRRSLRKGAKLEMDTVFLNPSTSNESQKDFLKIEEINERYSVGYKSYDEEFDAYSEMWIISVDDTLWVEGGIEANSCGIESVSPNGEYAVFSTVSVRWDNSSDIDSMLYHKWNAVLVDLSTAEVLKHCPSDCGTEWNNHNQWLNDNEVIFDALWYTKYRYKEHFVTASDGLICRTQPNLDAQLVGKIPYGSVIQVLETTPIQDTLMDDGREITGEWVKVRVSYTTYIFSLLSIDNDENYWSYGYVFSGYLEELNKAKIVTEGITESEFTQYESENTTNAQKLKKITDFDSIKITLGDKATWLKENDVGYLILNSLELSNGHSIKINNESMDYNVVAYYPNEEVLLFEGGHSMDFSISLKTGEVVETVGNPEYIINSPNNKLRITGYYGGQECSSYFFQEVNGNNLGYLVGFDSGSVYEDGVCNFKSFIWIDDERFVYSHLDYSTNSETGDMRYFKGKIIKLR
ncbi:MAG: hypothetical protein ACJA1C_002976 [Crocinitomicaceae bacterium]|jgi:hypothetical protein